MFKTNTFRYCIKCKTPTVTLGLLTLSDFKQIAIKQYGQVSIEYSIEALTSFIVDKLESEGIPQAENTYIIPTPCFITGNMEYNAAVIIKDNIFVFSNNRRYLQSIKGYGKINELLLG